MDKFFIGLAKLVIGGLTAVLSGYVLSVLWSWFVAGKFGLPPLSIPEALGITLIFTFLTFRLTKTDLENPLDYTSQLSWAIAKPLICLGYGWVILQFI